MNRFQANAGNYDKPVQFIAYTLSRNAVTNEAVKTPSVAGAAWAQVIPLQGRYAETARQLVEGAEMEFRIPFDPTLALTPSMAIRYQGADWPIGSVVNTDDANLEWRVVCKRAKA